MPAPFSISRFILFSAFLALMSSSCTPDYPEGVDLSFRSAKARIMNKWQWSLYREKGQNLTGQYLDYTLEFGESDFTICNGADCTVGKWFLSRDKKSINLIYPNSIYGKDMDIIHLGRNTITLETPDYAPKDTNYIKWELIAVKKKAL